MASRIAGSARRGAASGRIDMPLAGVAAVAVAFAVMIMPGDLLSRAVDASGLPQVLSAAQPPLGMKARAIVGLAAAAGTFVVLFALLRLLGRKGGSAPRRQEEAERDEEPQTPRLRRADVHPDAPARRPILAARELGEPEVRREPATQPFWRPDDFPAEPDAEEAAQDEQEPEALELDGPGIEMLAREAPAEPTSEDVVVAHVPDVPIDDSSLPDLIQRLERGLARRLARKGMSAERQTHPAPEPQPVPEPPRFAAPQGDDRLRSAIDNLQRMAARAG